MSEKKKKLRVRLQGPCVEDVNNRIESLINGTGRD